jgi:hypothetical protein
MNVAAVTDLKNIAKLPVLVVDAGIAKGTP